MARKSKRPLPPIAPRDGKRRRLGAVNVKEAEAPHTDGSQGGPELSIFDYVQHQAAKQLTEQQLSALLWSSPGDWREGLHTLSVAPGPPGPPGSGSRSNGTVDVLLRCTKCKAKASNTGNWAKLAKSQCGAKYPGWRWQQHAHALMPDIGGNACVHCGLHFTHTHRQHLALARCPCDTLKDGPDEVVEGSILLRGVLGLRSCWTAWYKGPRDGGSVGIAPASQPDDRAPRHLSSKAIRPMWDTLRGTATSA